MADTQRVKEPTSATPSSSQAMRPNILVVDDRKENLLATERVLRPLNANILKAESGNEALSLMLRHRFAVVLLDVQMPEMDGFETAVLMQEHDSMKSTPIIFVTAISKEERYATQAAELGAVDYIFKPINPEILRSKVKVYLDLFVQREQIVSLNAGYQSANSALQVEVAVRGEAERKAQAQLERLGLLHHITRAIGERQDLNSIFQIVIRSLEDLLSVDFACICLYDNTDHALTVAHIGNKSVLLAPDLATPDHPRIGIEANGLERCVRGEFVYEGDISNAKTPLYERLSRIGLRSVVSAPLQIESLVFGVVVIARVHAQGFSDGECEFVQQLSEHVALAAHQAQLYTALQQAYDDLRQTQQAVMQQERLRALGQMASGIAHDINNALSPIALYTQSLLEVEQGLSPRARQYLETTQRAVEDVAHTVARMRDFYRQREPQLMLVPVQVNQLIQQVIDLTRARWSDMPMQRGTVIEVKTDLPPDVPSVMGVESEIREALINLVLNAVDALPNGGALTLRTRHRKARDGSQVQVEVSDDGIGMDEETRRRCLEPFFTTKGERGTGLGLAMVYGVVQRHNAEIEISSERDRGTTTCITFPIQSESPFPERSATDETQAMPPRLRLLLIDDDPLLLQSLRSILETDGHLVVAANGGGAGIAAFEESKAKGEAFAAVITDLGMPHIDGRKVAAAIKAASSSTPVILLTGWGQRLIAEDDIPAHVDRVVSKPPRLREIRSTLAQLTRDRASPVSEPARM